MITPLAAAKAYASAQKAMGVEDGLGMGSAAAPAQGGFGDLVKAAISDAFSASKTAETQMAAQVAGKAELIDVVTAISAAEASLETVMAVRDQVISAYQEIMRMPI
ncbi:MAG: flagellar hook-basal body complex protein FliE [Phenylobacterium sp.]|uniref:flagellar hook-basal body complex protein FliE n=1 Tax=Phenylobacterium sp. TaxID=1871053 RepID=UPI001A5557DC|nr:flagellar hook-basal body complex protein FliE [Phenylobacterium sp.]MBL8770751.1 flagellar hook-basal body complex protein FliE [Phenylobacterium sp.]